MLVNNVKKAPKRSIGVKPQKRVKTLRFLTHQAINHTGQRGQPNINLREFRLV